MGPQPFSVTEAYRIWLSIPAAECPPHHYRLLGLPVFESDAQVIQAAADRQMMFLKSLQTGPHAGCTQQLLNQMSLAAGRLLNQQSKAAYDAELSSTLAAPQETTTRPAADAVAEAFSFRLDSDAPAKPARTRSAATPRAKQPKNPLIEMIKVIAGGIVGLLAGSLFIWSIGRFDAIEALFSSAIPQSAAVKPVDGPTRTTGPKQKAAPDVDPTEGPSAIKVSREPSPAPASPPRAPTTPAPVFAARPAQDPRTTETPDLRRMPTRSTAPVPSPVAASARKLPTDTAVQPMSRPAVAPRPFLAAPQVQPAAHLALAELAADERQLWVHPRGHFWKLADGSWTELAPNFDLWQFKEVNRTAAFVELQCAENQATIRLYADRCDASGAGGPFHTFHHGRFARPFDPKQTGSEFLIVKRACENYDQQLKAASQKLSDAFDDGQQEIRHRKMAPEAKLALLATIAAERTRFEKTGLVPWSQPMRVHSGNYLAAIGRARSLAETAIDKALDALLRQGQEEAAEGVRVLKAQTLAPLTIARIQCQATRGFDGEFSYRLLSNGKLNDATGVDHWHTEPGVLIFRVHGGATRDQISLPDSGTSFSASNNVGGAYNGKFVDQLHSSDIHPNHSLLVE